MTDLIERLERADGPSRRLFAEAFRIVYGSALSGTASLNYVDYAKSFNRFIDLLDVEAWTDAAMMLVSDRFMFDIGSDGPEGGPWACVTLQSGRCPDYSAHSAHPAIALCIAALKAKEADNG